MNRYGYFLEALQNGAYKWKAWISRTFAVSNLPSDLSPDKAEYPYQLFALQGRYAFYRPNETEPTVIEHASVDEPLIYANEPIDLKAGQVPNLTTDVTVSCGTLLFNFAVLVYSMEHRYPFVVGKADLNAIEKKLAKIVVDDVLDGSEEDPEKIYVKHLRRYIKSAGQLAGLSHLFVPAATPFTVRAAPGYQELRDRLIQENRDRLDDPTVISKIGEALERMDREWIASDPDNGFYVKDKQFASNRKKMFYMHGIEYDFDGSGQITFIPKSLNEGWDITKLPQMANSLRDGSYSRGALTALGGEKTKTIFRVMSGSVVSEDDCGTHLGLPMEITANNAGMFVGNYVMPLNQRGGSWEKIDEQSSSRFIGKAVYLRTPGYCVTEGANYCRACVGDFIIGKESTIANEAAVVGGQMLQLFLAAFHDKALKTTKYDIRRALN